jgi:hypothetical protein
MLVAHFASVFLAISCFKGTVSPKSAKSGTIDLSKDISASYLKKINRPFQFSQGFKVLLGYMLNPFNLLLLSGIWIASG